MTTKFQPLPAPGDILWCHFPQMEDLGNPGPKPRPALVVAVAPQDHVVRIAYGTSQRVNKLYPGEILLHPSDAGFSVSGLSGATKFDLNRLVSVEFDSTWFSPSPGVYANTPVPKMGILHPSYMQQIKKATAN